VGYSFPVPSTIVKKVVMDLKEYGVVQRTLLGVQYQEVTNDFVELYGKEYGISEIGGAWVAEVTKGGAAEAAGIQKGDVITAIDGVKIDSSARLSEIVAQHRPNDKIKIEIKREGKVKQIEVVLRNTAGKTAPVSKDDLYVAGALGGDFADLGEKAARQLGIKGGVRVTAVKEGGFLAKARVRPGFVITHVNEKAVASVADLERISEKVTSVDGIYPQTGRSASYSLVE
jgi:S1-C subfamily serine protease